MKTTIVFLGLMATAFSLRIPQLKRPIYQNATSDIQLRSGMDQYIYCYDGPNCAGIRIQINMDPVPDLGQSPYYFDNRIVSCLYNGIYILYDGRNFNQDNLNVSKTFPSLIIQSSIKYNFYMSTKNRSY